MARFFNRINTKPRRVLLARTDRLGDFVLTLPCLEVARQMLDCPIDVLCQPLVAPLLEHNPYVDRVIPLQPRVEDLLQNQGYDCLLVLVNDAVMQQLLPKLGFIPHRAGPLSKLHFLRWYNHPVLQKRSRSLHNEAWYNLELLGVFGQEPSFGVKPKLYLLQEEIEAFNLSLASKLPGFEPFQPFVVVHAGMRGSALNWGQEEFRQVVSQLLMMRLQVVLSGAGEQEAQETGDIFESLKGSFPGLLFNACNLFDLRQLAVLLSQAGVFVGPSTGPTHLANAVDTPVVGLYPPIQVQSATRWAPYLMQGQILSPPVVCGQKYKCRGESCPDFPCMKLITPTQVVDQVLLLLQG